MKYDLWIRNGTLVSSRGRRKADIVVRDGKIDGIIDSGQSIEADQILEAEGRFILPGLIDGHVHFRDPGLTHKEDIYTGSRSALYGGMTYVIDMPNVHPVTSTAERLRERIEMARERACVGMGFFALLTEENLGEMEELKRAGAVGFKIYLGTSVGEIAAPPDGVMLEQFRRAAELNMRIGFHAENNAINDHFTEREMERGSTSSEDLIQARPGFSEAESVGKAILFAGETGAKIHIYHVSSGRTVELIRRAKAAGVDITAETCPHYLLLDRVDYGRLGPVLKAFPPVREREDRKKLWEGMLDGTIDMIATDHAPHTKEEKSGDIWRAMAGVAGVEISARLMLTEVAEGRLSLERLVALMSEGPARVWNLEGRGKIGEGYGADLTLVDPERTGVIRNDDLHGKTNVTAFEGIRTVGMPVASVVKGKVFELV